jgi:hypothetical protein
MEIDYFNFEGSFIDRLDHTEDKLVNKVLLQDYYTKVLELHNPIALSVLDEIMEPKKSLLLYQEQVGERKTKCLKLIHVRKALGVTKSKFDTAFNVLIKTAEQLHGA